MGFKRVFVLINKINKNHINSEFSEEKNGSISSKVFIKSEFFYNISGSFYLGSEFFDVEVGLLFKVIVKSGFLI